MPINRLIVLFHVKRTHRPGLPGRIRFRVPAPETLRTQQEPTCT